MRLLIVKLGAIGDIVHTLPALSAIRRALPDAVIGWVAERRSSEILRDHPFIDRLFQVDTRQWLARPESGRMFGGSELGDLRRAGFEIAIDFQGLLKSAAIARASGASERWGFSRKETREAAGRLLLNRTAKDFGQTHVIKKNLGLARSALRLADDGKIEYGIATRAEHREEASRIVSRTGRDFVIMNPAGGWVTKLWHAEKFGRLADLIDQRLGLACVIATGPAEIELAERALSASTSANIVAVQPTLKGFLELVRQAVVYIGGDTGPTHLAAAARTPIVGIFGPTQWWRNGSLNPADICVERSDIACRIDCHRRECSNWICMDLDVETAFRAVEQRLAHRATLVKD